MQKSGFLITRLISFFQFSMSYVLSLSNGGDTCLYKHTRDIVHVYVCSWQISSCGILTCMDAYKIYFYTLIMAQWFLRKASLIYFFMKDGGLLNKHICEKSSNISSETAETVNFHFSHYKSMGTISCLSNQSSFLTGIKNTTYIIEANVLSMCAKFFIPLMVSEKKIFKHFYEN